MNLNVLKDNFKKLLLFSFFKGVVFFSVLLFSIFGWNHEYVKLEENLAYALLLAPIIGCGILASFAHQNLYKNDDSYNGIIWCHLIIITIIFSIISTMLFIIDDDLYLISSLLSIMTSSRFISQKYKIKSEVIISSFWDSIPYVGVIISFCFLYVDVQFNKTLYLLSILMSIFTILFSINHLRISELYSLKLVDTLNFYLFGFKTIMVGTIVSYFILYPRLEVNSLLSIEDSENVFLVLRLASVTILLYQFFYVRYIKKIFTLKKNELLYRVLILSSVCIICSSITVAIASLFGLVEFDEYIIYGSIYSGLWVSSSFLQYFVNREHATFSFISYVIVASGVIYTLNILTVNMDFYWILVGVPSLVVLCQLLAVYFPIVNVIKTKFFSEKKQH